MNSGGFCPICDFAFNLRKSGAEEDIAVAKTLMPKQRFYSLVVDREDPTLTPKWWGFGKEIYQQLLEALLSEDWNIFMDLEQGHDAEVSVVTKAGKTEYSAPKLVFKKKQTRLADTNQKVQEVLSKIVPLSEVFKPLTESEINEKLATWLDMKDSDGSEVTKTGSQTQDTSEGNSSGNYKDLDDAFEQALK